MKFFSALAIASGLLLGQVASAATISNNPTGGSISSFGWPDSQTYGEVFVAPVTGTLDSFSLHLVGGVGDIVGAVSTWNGTASYGSGFGTGATLYNSAPVASGAGGVQSFSPGVNVTAGSIYVAFLTVFGQTDSGVATSMPLGDALPGGSYFVWNNGYGVTNPFANPSWNYFYNFGNALFSAKFTPTSPVPLPAGGLLLIGALCMLGFSARRRQS